MSFNEDCIVGTVAKPCWDDPAIRQPVVLCRRHLAEVVIMAADAFIATETAATVQDATDASTIGRARVLDVSSALSGQHAEAVYFVSNGNTIKIGFTTNLRSRLGSFALDKPNVLILLSGGRELEGALHRRFNRHRIRSTEWFTDAPAIRRFIKTVEQGRPVPSLPRTTPTGRGKPPRSTYIPDQRYPDGIMVRRDEWPDLYRVFCRLSEEQGYATKEDLVEHGPFASRDTVRRALDVWVQHGVLVRKAGRAEQFHLPKTDTDDATLN